CQMAEALVDTVAVDLSCGKGNHFRANGSTITFPGFLSVYEEGLDDSKNDDDQHVTLLPILKIGEKIKLLDILASQHFTEPPPRFNEASLIKALEEYYQHVFTTSWNHLDPNELTPLKKEVVEIREKKKY
ncbi:MAG: hypothetical protein KGK14_09960, partial [Bacteroidota bacterium]|nr:hypothetical protein [Bacteroidota bacterium]